MNYKNENGTLTVYLEKRIDSYTVDAVDKEISGIVASNPAEKFIADCKDLEFIASAGLRILLKLGKMYSDFKIVNVSREIYEVLDMTGFTKMFDTKRSMREVSLDGCKLIGVGFSSHVYRYDRETVVKSFSKNVTLERIYNETASAKKSFVSGIPTAIPYDVVKCGEGYGTVFELIDADTLSQNFMDHPERFDELMEKYVELLKKFHSTKAMSGAFPDIYGKYHTWANGLKRFFTEEQLSTLIRIIDSVPNRDTMIHVDCHSGNIMVQDGKLIFVDMADVSIGHPLFDIGAEYFHYMIMRQTSLGAKVIFRIEPEDSELPVRVWNELVRRYFDKANDEELKEIHKMLEYFGALRCLIMVAKHAHIEEDKANELIGSRAGILLNNADEVVRIFSDADKYFALCSGV